MVKKIPLPRTTQRTRGINFKKNDGIGSGSGRGRGSGRSRTRTIKRTSLPPSPPPKPQNSALWGDLAPSDRRTRTRRRHFLHAPPPLHLILPPGETGRMIQVSHMSDNRMVTGDDNACAQRCLVSQNQQNNFLVQTTSGGQKQE